MNEEINRVKVVVINSKLTIVQRCSTKDSIAMASIDNTCYCFYIKDELYIFSTSISVELIEFLKMC